MYRAEVLADSLNPTDGSRLTTFLIEFPRVVLAETVTHRVNSDSWGPVCERTTTPDVSKNSASGRAIPHGRLVAKILADPYLPAFTGEAKGMQGDYLGGDRAAAAAGYWLGARDAMVEFAAALNGVGVHKQDSNRLLEPWAWVTQVVTSSRWDNFFALRCHEAAHPAFRRVARMMFLARRGSTPRRLQPWEWHLPFCGDATLVRYSALPGDADPRTMPIEIKRSVARCCWVSYDNAEKQSGDDAVNSTVDRLHGMTPAHGSPFEHQAYVDGRRHCVTCPPYDERYRSNLGENWVQLRKLLPAERCDRYGPSDEEVRAWPEYAEFLPA